MSKNTILGIAVGLPLLIIAFSVLYYFTLFLPQSVRSSALTKNQESCAQMEKTQLEQWKEVAGSSTGMLSTTNHYNSELQKCIVEISDTTFSSGTGVGLLNSDTYVSATLVDAVENATIASCNIDHALGGKQNVIACTDSKGKDITPEQFYVIEKKYMERDQPSL